MAIGAAASVVAILSMVAGILIAVNQIIENCERYYDNINRILERINNASEGRFVKELTDIDDKLKANYKDLIAGLRKMADEVQSAYDETKRSDEESAQEIRDANSGL